jgi:hypothetical protein
MIAELVLIHAVRQQTKLESPLELRGVVLAIRTVSAVARAELKAGTKRR